eukprot:UC1_evm3s623
MQGFHLCLCLVFALLATPSLSAPLMQRQQQRKQREYQIPAYINPSLSGLSSSSSPSSAGGNGTTLINGTVYYWVHALLNADQTFPGNEAVCGTPDTASTFQKGEQYTLNECTIEGAGTGSPQASMWKSDGVYAYQKMWIYDHTHGQKDPVVCHPEEPLSGWSKRLLGPAGCETTKDYWPTQPYNQCAHGDSVVAMDCARLAMKTKKEPQGGCKPNPDSSDFKDICGVVGKNTLCGCFKGSTLSLTPVASQNTQTNRHDRRARDSKTNLI